jgi:hypothetical protein
MTYERNRVDIGENIPAVRDIQFKLLPDCLRSYRISGLHLRSELPLAGAISAEDGVAPEVLVRRRAVTARLDAPVLVGSDWQLSASQFLFSVEDIGRFLVSDGKTIDVELLEGTDPAEASLYLTGTGLSALLLQRGSLVLHASAVSRDGQAIALCGESGAGKSTLAAALCEAGWSFVSDDVSRVEPDAEDGPLVWPDGRSLKLFEQSIETLALANRRGSEVRTGVGKHYVTPLSQSAAAIVLGAVYALRYHDEPSTEFVRLSPLDGAQVLLNESHRPLLALAMAGSSRHLKISAAIVSRVPVFLLKRPRGLRGIDRTAQALISHWESLRAARNNGDKTE